MEMLRHLGACPPYFNMTIELFSFFQDMYLIYYWRDGKV